MIDCDLRRASASAFVDSPAKGLSNYLVGEVTNVKDVIVSNTITDGLSVLPVGTIPPNPAELLELPRFADMVNALRADYDYILIDCPPVEMMADAQIVGSVTDRTIFVIRAGYFERTMLPEVERIYNEKSLKHGGGAQRHSVRCHPSWLPLWLWIRLRIWQLQPLHLQRVIMSLKSLLAKIGIGKEDGISSGLFIGHTDFHSHILPGVDDGVKTIGESIAILDR